LKPNRLQLTLFLDESISGTIERIRSEYNPIQFELIKAHVTLCREHELEQLDKVIANLKSLDHGTLTINFGKVARSRDGNGVLLPANIDNKPFQCLRKQIFWGINDHPDLHEPHITLMHPRNSTCTDLLFEQIKKNEFPAGIEFRKISLIEQEMGKKWKVLGEFEL